MKRIPLTQGKFALVDDNDYERVNKHKWRARKDCRTWYALTNVRENGKIKTIYLHRFIFENPDSKIEIDHIDHNGLNCQKNNLRKCSRAQNAQNTQTRLNSASGYKGVRWHTIGKKWQARIRVNGKLKSLGLFSDPVEAAKAYNKAAIKQFGNFAYLNKV